MKNYTLTAYQSFTDLTQALSWMRWNNKKFGHRIFLLKRKIDSVLVYDAVEIEKINK